jgi:pimeloyl-ACP methyl ester carboxylesterase
VTAPAGKATYKGSRITNVTERWDVEANDGGTVAVWIDGNGPPLVLVHGSISNHTGFAPLVGELRGEFTTFAMDRRGFGASPDGPGSYSAEREFTDVATVVGAVASRTRQPVVLFGHSWGASCALGAAPHLPSLRALVLYEPSLGVRLPPGWIDRIETRVAAGDNEGALIDLLANVAGVTEDQIVESRAAANWPERVATAPTIAREARIEDGWQWQAGQFAGIRVPTLLLTGSETTPELAAATSATAAAITGARVHVLEGHGHIATRVAPASSPRRCETG